MPVGVSGNGIPAAVLFDLDGTLVSTRALYVEAYRAAVEPYVMEGLTQEDILALRPTSELAFIRAVVAEADLEVCLAGFYQAYRDLHARLFQGVYEGVPELLASLRQAAVPLGIVTGKSRRSWQVTSVAAPLGPFDVLVFDDDVRAPKPDPHGLELALDVLGVPADRVPYVGDTVSDMQAARAAGLRPVMALWSRDAEDRAQLARDALAEGAEATVEWPWELEELFGLV